jgi:two-component SAPR family response regulator
MYKTGPLVIVDDDREDQDLMLLTLENLGIKNEIKVFSDGGTALKYLYETSDLPFLIISDMNMPKMSGLEFKKTIDSCSILKAKGIPFVFMSTCTTFISDVGQLNIQGYFVKSSSMSQLKNTVNTILTYWSLTHHTMRSRVN